MYAAHTPYYMSVSSGPTPPTPSGPGANGKRLVVLLAAQRKK